MRHFILTTLFIFFSLSNFADARGGDIDPGIDFLSKAEIRMLLGDYPALGTLAGQSDLDTLLEYQETRTKEMCDYAASQDSVSLKSLFVNNNGPLSKKEARWLKIRLAPLYAEAGYNILKAKKLYNRPRPYDSHPELKPCIPKETSMAYPSGHTTLGRALGRVLSEIYPERAALFMKRADEISENRMIGGVHYPTDVVAGKILGDEIADVVIKSKFFDSLR
jgi:acid phosphatase (class A)